MRISLLLLLTTFSPYAWSGDWRFDDVDRVVAIADIHGAYDAMTATLQSAEILDEKLTWSGGNAHLVIVGDILDRGPGSRSAMELLMRLELEAEAAGGKVHVLFGNHESMPMTGDMRYVSAAEYAAFAEEEDLDERTRWFELFLDRVSGDAETLQPQFDRQFPPGYFAMRRAFRVDGRYGEWLLRKNIIVVVNDTAFVHGGLSPLVAKVGLDGINGKLKDQLREYVSALGVLTDAEILLPTDSHHSYESILSNYLPSLDTGAQALDAVKMAIRLGETELLEPSGPLWYRGNVVCQGIVEGYRLDAALAAIGAERVVVGHTPTPNRKVLQRFGGRLIEIDTGMLNFYYKGSGNALVLEDGNVSVVNQSEDAVKEPMDHPRRVGRRSGNLSTEQLRELLLSGEVVSSEKTDTATLVGIRQGNTSIDAIFEKRKARDFYPGVAAYRLDRLLDLDMVPVTVMRVVDGDEGSLQFLPSNTSNEAERSATGQGGGASCPLTEQWAAMYVFDVLIYNEGRSLQHMLYDASSWHLMLSEHDRAFSARKGRPQHLKNVALPVTQGWKNALTSLSDEVLEEQFADVLDKRRIRALAARRDEILASR